MDHFANAFSLTPGRCFRMVALPGVGHPNHCPEPVAWYGRWRAADNRLYRVDACESHAEGLGAPLVPKGARKSQQRKQGEAVESQG